MKCMHCEEGATYIDSHRRYCDMHYRFQQMRQDSAKRKKYSPTKEELLDLVPENMECPECKKEMVWRRKHTQKGLNNQITLQHWVDGSISLICLCCNVRHSSMVQDSFRSMSKDYKFCPVCQQIKHENNFGIKNSRSVMKRNSYCKPCNIQKSKLWVKNNKEKVNATQRAYRLKRKLSGNPILRKRDKNET